MRITAKGQVTIPEKIRKDFGFLPETEIDFVVKGKDVCIIKKGGGERGTKLVEHLRGKATVKMTTNEIMALTRKGR